MLVSLGEVPSPSVSNATERTIQQAVDLINRTLDWPVDTQACKAGWWSLSRCEGFANSSRDRNHCKHFSNSSELITLQLYHQSICI
eukprot:1927029-Amphidinium_carterae.2